MTPRRQETVESLGEALRVMGRLRAQLRSTEHAYRRAVRAMEQGRPVAEVLHAITAAATRLDLNAELNALEVARHRARLSMIAAGLEEGMSIGEVGRALGFSRQLAARYAKEAHAADDHGADDHAAAGRPAGGAGPAGGPVADGGDSDPAPDE